MGEPIITPEAAADLDDAWDYLSARSLKAADRLIEGFLSSAKRYAQFRNTGQKRDEISPGLRCFVVRPYVAFYRIDVKKIMRET